MAVQEPLVKMLTQGELITAATAVVALITLVHTEAAAVVALVGLTITQAQHLAVLVVVVTVAVLIIFNQAQGRETLVVAAVLLGTVAALKMAVLVLLSSNIGSSNGSLCKNRRQYCY